MFFDDDYHDEPMMGADPNYNPNLYYQQGGVRYRNPPPPPMSEAERTALSERVQKESSERHQYMEIAGSAAIISFISLNLIVYKDEINCGNFQTWLLGSLGIYTCDLIMCMNQLMQVKKLGRENLWLLLLYVVILSINTGWYIWGNIIYYHDWQECAVISELHPIGQNPGITSAVRFMVFIGYITFCKCCMITLCAAIGIPCLCYHYRQASQPQWEGAAPDLLKRLARTKFESDPEQGGATECCVCLVEFERGENVVILPCNNKHVFHDACVKTWLEKNNSCPLCKAPITQEALQAQNR